MNRKQVGYFKNKMLEKSRLKLKSATVLCYITQRTIKHFHIYVTNSDNIPNTTGMFFFFHLCITTNLVSRIFKIIYLTVLKRYNLIPFNLRICWKNKWTKWPTCKREWWYIYRKWWMSCTGRRVYPEHVGGRGRKNSIW